MRSVFAAVLCSSMLLPALAAQAAGGTGPYSAVMEADASLPTHTIYRPADLKPFGGTNVLPVIVWGNGACANIGNFFEGFLTELASHGFIAVAIGPIGKAPDMQPRPEGAPPPPRTDMGTSKSSQLVDAMNWAEKQNQDKVSPYFGRLAPDQVVAAGMSCGGLQALEVSTDPRVKTTMVMNSGIFIKPGPIQMPVSVSKPLLDQLHAPVIYIMGGRKDIAYENGADDYARISKVPAMFVNMEVGHGGTYSEPNGGEFGRVASAWVKWQMKGDEDAAKLFQGRDCGLCSDSRWTIERKH